VKTIYVQFDPPPIPNRSCDWHAWVDGEEENLITCDGPTKERAIENLIDDYELDRDDYFVVEK
jgi:hypothetical protein